MFQMRRGFVHDMVRWDEMGPGSGHAETGTRGENMPAWRMLWG